MAKSSKPKTTTRSRTKTTRKKSAGKRASKPLVSYTRRKEILGLFLMALALILGLSIVTHSPADTNLVRGLDVESVFNPVGPRAENLLGTVGALLSHLLVAKFLGFPVLALALVLFVVGFLVFRHRSLDRMSWIALLTFLGTVLVSGILGWLGEVMAFDAAQWSGGLGMAMASGLRRILGSVGSMILLAVSSAIVLLLALNGDVQAAFDRFGAIGERLRSWFSGIGGRYKESAAERKRVKEAKAASADKEVSPRTKVTEAQVDFPDDAGMMSTRRPPVPIAKDSEPVVFENAEPIPASTPDSPEPDSGNPSDPSFEVRERVEEERVNLDDARPRPVRSDFPYEFPSVSLLEPENEENSGVDHAELEENKQTLVRKLLDYKVEIRKVDAVVGPTVTLYELTPAPHIKISQIKSLEDDLAMAMAARGIRMLAPIPGKSVVGVEIPNRHRELVRISSMLNTTRFRDSKMALPVALGKTIEGEVFIDDLRKMPHLLVAGATGSGKSVGVNCLIITLMYACHPANLKFVMVDPKRVELPQYAKTFRHFIAMPEDAEEPITTDVKEAMTVLRSCLKEMEDRYDLLAQAGVRDITEYNQRYATGKLPDEDGHKHLPFIVIIIDELADLMMTAGKEIEGPIARLAQMARAVGLHLVVATQRPSVNVITGLIKANFPSRIAFQVASGVDSRTIIDQYGAEQLVGNGDLLYMNGSKILRLQSPFISLDEVERVTAFIGNQPGPDPYRLPFVETEGGDSGSGGPVSGSSVDDLFDAAARIIVRSQQGSVSLLQRKLSVGYTRAARIVDQLEQAGIVGAFEGSKARQVLIPDEAQLDSFLEMQKDVDS